MMDVDNINLLKKFLANECSDAELQHIGTLLGQNETKEILAALIEEQNQAEWNTPIELNAVLLERLRLRKAQVNKLIIADGLEHSTKEVNPPIKKLSILKYAAVWIGLFLLVGASLWRMKSATQQNIAFIEKTNLKAVPVKYILPDQSEVFLGSGSKLKYPQNFKDDSREIELQGEAFFEVRHMEKRPFIIHTDDINTQVLGTSFKIQAYKNQPIVVAVATGKVGVINVLKAHSKTLALLLPGRKITWNKKTGEAVLGSVDIQSLAQWKLGELVFDELELGQVAKQLTARYGVEINIVDHEIENYQISGTFSANEPVEKVLKLLSTLGKFKYEQINSKTFKIYTPIE